jgi:hypothetical protein
VTLGFPGATLTEGQVDALPDPELFRDAWMLAGWGTFSPRDLDDTDALLLNLTRRLKRILRG